ncbi:MAG: SLC13 family permease, partial [Rhizobiaceae bacterium]
AHITMMSATGAVLSAFMNNVAALALLMPVDLQAAKKSERSPRGTLMPLSFATILGGLVTLIGTPPNIIIASFRERSQGEAFSMFDFAPVGLACAVVGITFVALIGWRLIPNADQKVDAGTNLMELEGYLAELLVPEGSDLAEQQLRSLQPLADENDIVLLGLVRGGRRLPGFSKSVELREGDIVLVEASAAAIDTFRGAAKLEFVGESPSSETAQGSLSLLEVVVPKDSKIEGRSAISLRLTARRGVSLLGISRQGKRIKERVRHAEIAAGDILLLIGPSELLQDTSNWLGTLPLAERGLNVTQHKKAWLAAGVFAAAIAVASFGLIYLATALAIVVVAYVLLDIVPLRSVYDHIEWPVIVLLGSMIPLGVALEQSGGTELIANKIIELTAGWGPVVVLTVLMVVVMTLSDVLNNTATAVIGAPIAVNIAQGLNVNPDPFLMAVAVAASCAFLTPIGHKNNTLVMGPGGYAFGDYWRMGLPLEIIVIAVAVPMILFVWPL